MITDTDVEEAGLVRLPDDPDQLVRTGGSLPVGDEHLALCLNGQLHAEHQLTFGNDPHGRSL